MTVDRDTVVEAALASFKYINGRFYGTAEGLSLGVGLFYEGVRFPAFDATHSDYATLEGRVYVLTHECDADQQNVRAFNDYVLVCPVIDFYVWAQDFASAKSVGALMGFLPDLAGDEVYRAIFLPPTPEIPNGGILYLNSLASVHVSEFSQTRASAICALSEYAQSIVDKKIQNHLLRPKAELLPII